MAVLGSMALGCRGSGKRSTDSQSVDLDGSRTDSNQLASGDPASSDSGNSDANDGLVSQELAKDVLYTVPDSARVASLDVDERYLYLLADGALMRALKNGQGSFEAFAPNVQHWVHSVYIDATQVFWVSDGTLRAYDEESQSTRDVFTPAEQLRVMSLAGDSERLYWAGPGCGALGSVTKSGDDPRSARQEVSDSVGGAVPIHVGADYVYCSGGIGGVTTSKIYRWPKAGGDIELLLDLGPADEQSYRPEAAALLEVGTRLLFVRGYAASRWLHSLESIDLSTKAAIRLTEVASPSPSRLHFDSTRRAVFWKASATKAIAKFRLSNQQLEQRATDAIYQGPLAADDQAVYWVSQSRLWKAAKF